MNNTQHFSPCIMFSQKNFALLKFCTHLTYHAIHIFTQIHIHGMVNFPTRINKHLCQHLSAPISTSKIQFQLKQLIESIHSIEKLLSSVRVHTMPYISLHKYIFMAWSTFPLAINKHLCQHLSAPISTSKIQFQL